MIDTTIVSSRGQVVIPEDIRRHLNLKEGTKLVIREQNNRLILESENNFLKNLEMIESEKEKLGWLSLAEKSLAELWDNPEDEKAWSKYL